MPTYEYKCFACDHTFEQFLKLSERKAPTKKACPSCLAKGKVQQVVLSLPGVAVDTSHRIDGKASGQFKDIMQKVSQAPGIKGSARERAMKNRYGI